MDGNFNLNRDNVCAVGGDCNRQSRRFEVRQTSAAPVISGNGSRRNFTGRGVNLRRAVHDCFNRDSRAVAADLLKTFAVPFIIYPFTKRFTAWCHLFLGLAIAMAPAGAWVALTEKISLPMIILCVAVALWIGAFDAVYGAQDEQFDKSQRLHSLATKYGAAGALTIAKILHAISIVCFIIVGLMLSLGKWYFVGVAIAAVALIYQHAIVRAGDYREVTQAYFMRNGIVSIAIFIFTWLSYD